MGRCFKFGDTINTVTTIINIHHYKHSPQGWVQSVTSKEQKTLSICYESMLSD
jgi:hypothetical protein